MKAEALPYLEHIHKAGELIRKAVAGKTYEDFLTDEFFRGGVERQFEIIGEALTNLRRRDPETFARIPEGGQIIGFRNVISHEYFAVAPPVVWNAVQRELPLLRPVIAAMLAEADEDPELRRLLGQ